MRFWPKSKYVWIYCNFQQFQIITPLYRTNVNQNLRRILSFDLRDRAELSLITIKFNLILVTQVESCIWVPVESFKHSKSLLRWFQRSTILKMICVHQKHGRISAFTWGTPAFKFFELGENPSTATDIYWWSIKLFSRTSNWASMLSFYITCFHTYQKLLLWPTQQHKLHLVFRERSSKTPKRMLRNLFIMVFFKYF